MSIVLIAPIGEHPAIITATVDVLETMGINIQVVHILCPNEKLINEGAEWAELELEENDKVQAEVHTYISQKLIIENTGLKNSKTAIP